MQLFDRTTRSVELTLQGLNFLPVAVRILDELARGIDDLQALANKQKGSVVVTATSSFINVVIAPAVAMLGQAHPGITVRIFEDTAKSLVNRVLNGEADFGITTIWQKPDDIEAELLLRDRLGVLCPVDHPLAQKAGELTWSDLAAYRIASLGPGAGIREMVENNRRVAMVLPVPTYEVSTVSSLLSLVENNVGIAIFPRIATLSGIAKNLAFRPVSRPSLFRDLSLIKRKGRSLTPAADALVQCMYEQLRNLRKVDRIGLFASKSLSNV
jgi:LysR family carnitine catabolism transcriptional activator